MKRNRKTKYIQIVTRLEKDNGRPYLFIDCDSVSTQPRPNLNGFLRWCMANFQCYWLTSVPHYWLENLFTSSYATDIATGIRYFSWDKTKLEDLSPDLDFYWIEDGRYDEEMDAAGLDKSRYIEVTPRGRDELYAVQEKITAILVKRGLPVVKKGELFGYAE